MYTSNLLPIHLWYRQCTYHNSIYELEYSMTILLSNWSYSQSSASIMYIVMIASVLLPKLVHSLIPNIIPYYSCNYSFLSATFSYKNAINSTCSMQILKLCDTWLPPTLSKTFMLFHSSLCSDQRGLSARGRLNFEPWLGKFNPIIPLLLQAHLLFPKKFPNNVHIILSLLNVDYATSSHQDMVLG